MRVALKRGRVSVEARTLNLGDCFILVRNGNKYIKTDLGKTISRQYMIKAVNLETGKSLDVGQDEMVNIIELKASEV